MSFFVQGHGVVARVRCSRFLSLGVAEQLFCSDEVSLEEHRIQQRVRQHVNPLTKANQRPIQLENDWVRKYYSHPSNPFVVDVGCCRGRWALHYATQHPSSNVLGLDIRQPVIDIANSYLDKKPVSNVKFLCSNANVDIARLLKDINHVSSINMITIQFPDPFFKKYQHKRRVVNTLFLNNLAKHMQAQTRIYLQTDVFSLMEYMVDVFSANPYFSEAEGYKIQTLDSNAPICGVTTERERQCNAAGDPVFRMLYHRNSIEYNSEKIS